MTTLAAIVREHLNEAAPKPSAHATLLTGGDHTCEETRKTYSVTRDVIRTVGIPEIELSPTGRQTYFPLKHDSLIEQVEQACQQRGIEVLDRKYALNRSRTQMLGTYLLKGAEMVAPDFQLAMGIRNSTDKSMVIGLVSGAYVLACENNSFSGEINLERKHTRYAEADLPRLIGIAVDRFMAAAVDQARTFAHWKSVEVGVDQATLLAVDAAEHSAIPGSAILAIKREFVKPRHAEFLNEGRHTAWTLYNSFTQFLTHDREEVAPTKAQRDFLRVHRTLAEAFPLPAASVN